MAKVITIKTAHNTETEIHMLNPKEVMEGFGGSRHGLVVGKTASLVTRTNTASSCDDVERNITDECVWEFICKCINGEIKATAKRN